MFILVGTVSAALTTSPLSGECSTVELRSYNGDFSIPRTFRVSPYRLQYNSWVPVRIAKNQSVSNRLRPMFLFFWQVNGCQEWTRTTNHSVNSRTLCHWATWHQKEQLLRKLYLLTNNNCSLLKWRAVAELNCSRVSDSHAFFPMN